MGPQIVESSHAIGIDIGGTTSRAALISSLGKVVASARRPTSDQYDDLLHWIATTAGEWTKSFPLASGNSIPIGLALPGVVDPATGTLIRSVNLPWLEGQPIVDQLEKECGHRPALMTDAEAATWGEYVDFGSPATSFAHLRLGTGVACGVVVDGRLIPTDPQRRTHWPVLVVDERADAPLCPCGLRGCLEGFAGGDSIMRQARDMGFRDLSEFEHGVHSNYEAAVRIMDQAAIGVCRAIGNLAVKFAVTNVVLGGGILAALPSLFLRVQQALAKSASPGVCIRMSRLGDDAGIIGAARFALHPRH